MKNVAFFAAAGAAFALALAATVHAPLQAAPAAGPLPPSYTNAQAWTGRMLYDEHCAECHGGGLEGHFGPALAGGGDRAQFETGRYVYAYTSVFMPHGDPGELRSGDYLAIMAFLYQQHHHAAGTQPLTASAVAADTSKLGN